MKIVAVFHGAKAEGLEDKPREIGANPPMTVEGMEKILALLPAINEQYQFRETMYCSMVARALCTMSVLAMDIGFDEVTCIRELGQFGNLDKGKVISYPGHETDDELTWQEDAMEAVRKIWRKRNTFDEKVLAVSHRPIIGALVALTRGITDKEGIAKIIADPSLTKNGFVVFNYEGGDMLTLVQ